MDNTEQELISINNNLNYLRERLSAQAELTKAHTESNIRTGLAIQSTMTICTVAIIITLIILL